MPPKYFMMTAPVEPDETLADFFLDDRFDESWFAVMPFEEPPPVPLVLTWDPDNEAGRRMSHYSGGIVLMSRELFAALVEFGVDNVQPHPVVIRSSTGKPDCHDYLGVNVIGLVKAVDRTKSVVLDEGDGIIDMFFESVEIDLAAARDLLLFRLAESVGALLVHERVVEHLRVRSGFGLTFVNPADFVG